MKQIIGSLLLTGLLVVSASKVHGAAAGTCQSAFEGEDARAARLEIGRSRATTPILDLLNGRDRRSPDDWIEIDLVQDMPHIEKAPRVPVFLLTFAAKQGFRKKMQPLLEDGHAKKDLPKVTRMYFEAKEDWFQGQSTKLVGHVYVKLQIKDLPYVIETYVQSVYHPTLGNKVFKIDLLNQYWSGS